MIAIEKPPLVAVFQLWCARLDSNQEPAVYKTDALPLSYARFLSPIPILQNRLWFCKSYAPLFVFRKLSEATQAWFR